MGDNHEKGHDRNVQDRDHKGRNRDRDHDSRNLDGDYDRGRNRDRRRNWTRTSIRIQARIRQRARRAARRDAYSYGDDSAFGGAIVPDGEAYAPSGQTAGGDPATGRDSTASGTGDAPDGGARKRNRAWQRGAGRWRARGNATTSGGDPAGEARASGDAPRRPGGRRRNTALLLIAAGLFLLLQHTVGFVTLSAALLIALGIYRIRTIGDKRGFLIAGVGSVVLVSHHFGVIFAIILISLGLFYKQSKNFNRSHHRFTRKHQFVTSLKWDREPWVLRSMGMWNLVGELRLDLSLAIPEQEETVIVLQGIVGDIDVLIPSGGDLGVSVCAGAVIGQLELPYDKASGILNRFEWTTPGYEASEHKLKLIISYLVGDVDIKMW